MVALMIVPLMLSLRSDTLGQKQGAVLLLGYSVFVAVALLC